MMGRLSGFKYREVARRLRTFGFEFDRSGRHALVSVYEYDGERVVYDAKTLTVVKRLPMRKPSGKYNVFNKISRSEGTSH